MGTILSTLGPDAPLVDEDVAKAKIQEIERANKAIRDALVAIVGADATPGKSNEKKRDDALMKLKTDNPLFRVAVDDELFKLRDQGGR
jgi:hypothetical protein